MLTVEEVRRRDQRYYEKNKEAIMARRAAYAAAKAAIDTAMAVPKEVALITPVSVVNGWPEVRTPSLNRIASREELA